MPISWVETLQFLALAATDDTSDLPELAEAIGSLLLCHAAARSPEEKPALEVHDGVSLFRVQRVRETLRAEGFVWWIDQSTDPLEATVVVEDGSIRWYTIRVGDPTVGRRSRTELDKDWRRGRLFRPDASWTHSLSAVTTPDHLDRVAALARIVRYFKCNVESQESLLPERDLARIALLRCDSPHCTAADVRNVLAQARSMPPESHYSGTGWVELLMVLEGLASHLHERQAR